MPGTIYHVPKWLIDPLGPLAVRWSYLPFIAGWLIRYLAAGRRDRVESQARALKDMLGCAVEFGTHAIKHGRTSHQGALAIRSNQPVRDDLLILGSLGRGLHHRPWGGQGS